MYYRIFLLSILIFTHLTINAATGKWQSPGIVNLPLNVKHENVSGNAHIKVLDSNVLWTLPAVQNNAEIKYDLKALKINPAFYDEIRIKFKTSQSIIMFAVALSDYPVKDLHRNWYSKIAITPQQWTEARFDLRLDDDGWWGSPKKMNGQFLKIKLHKRFLRKPGEPAYRKITIKSIEFIRYPVNIAFSEIDAKLRKSSGKLIWTYTVELRNNLTSVQAVNLSLDTKYLKYFSANWKTKKFTLQPREYKKVKLELSIPIFQAGKLASLYSEKVEIFVKSPGSKVPAISPLTGYRPKYIWATIPPNNAKLDIKTPLVKNKNKILKLADTALAEDWGVPLHGPAFHPQGYIDKKTNSKLRPLSWFRHKSRKTGEDVNSEKINLAFIGRIHTGNFKRAELLGKAYELTGDLKYAEAARDVFLEYVYWYPYLPTTNPASSSGLTRLDQSSLMTCFWFKNVIDAYARIKDTKALGDGDRKLIIDKFISPELKAIYSHNVEYSNMQVHHFATYTRAVIAINKHWNLLGDALYGDHGFYAIVDRTFTEDGMSHEGGVYHWFTLKPLMDFVRQMQKYGINVMNKRFKRVFDGGIINSQHGIASKAIAPYYIDAYRAYHDPAYIATLKSIGKWPLDGEKAVEGKLLDKSTLQKSNGYLWLREKSAKGFRALSINYIMQWERSEHDRLHFTIYDSGKISSDVGRITYGSKQGKVMYKTLSHNTVVVDKKDQQDLPSNLAAFLDRKQLPAGLIIENEKSPIYEKVKFSRVVALLDGIFFVGDIYYKKGKHTFDWPFYALWQPWAHKDSAKFEFPFKMSHISTLGYKFMNDIKGCNNNNGFTVSSLIPLDGRKIKERPNKKLYITFASMPNALICSAKVPRGHRPKPGPMLLIRQQGKSIARFGAAFDITTRDGVNRVKSVKNIPVSDKLSGAWEVKTDSGTYLIVINRSGKNIKVKNINVNKILEIKKI